MTGLHLPTLNTGLSRQARENEKFKHILRTNTSKTLDTMPTAGPEIDAQST